MVEKVIFQSMLMLPNLVRVLHVWINAAYINTDLALLMTVAVL